MKTLIYFISLFSVLFTNVHAQVKIGGTPVAPVPSAVLELDGGNNRGLLLPRMRKMDIDVIQNPAEGLTIYATDEQAVYLRKSLVWEKQAPFSLPYTSFFNTASSALNVANFSLGSAISGYGESGRGVYGRSNSGYGVYGEGGPTGVGGYFINHSNGGTALVTHGKTGIGTNGIPGALLHIDGSDFSYSSTTVLISDNAAAGVQFQNDDINKGYIQADVDNMVIATNFTNTTGKVILRTNNADRLLVDNAGNVAIGGTPPPPGYKLAVKGKIAATDFNVVASGSWPDYVFSPTYKLRSLEETEAYINEHKHLPNIPAAAVVDKEGFALGDMQKRMMEKIEELTLYLIEAKKEINTLKKQVQVLQTNK